MSRRKKLTQLFREFFNSEKAGGVILIICTVFSLLLSNSVFEHSYHQLWSYPMFGHTFEHWINDGLMTIFFLLVGLELEREVYIGELSNLKEAMLPIFGALGGMVVPACLFTLFNYGSEFQSGAGIPMATDIAFAIGVLSLLGSRVPVSVKVFLTALAVIDDLGAILVIALFYSSNMSWLNLGLALAVFGGLLAMNKLGVRKLLPYLLGGVVMWYFMLQSGVHATITGVLLAFAIPFEKGEKESISYKLQHFLHKPVAFFILPLFALANTAIAIKSSLSETMTHSYSIGIALGLVLGKPLGIFSFSYLANKFKWCRIPSDISIKVLFNVGFLGGIGFTMSIFITLLAFDQEKAINDAKLAILVSSLTASIVGLLLLNYVLKPSAPENLSE